METTNDIERQLREAIAASGKSLNQLGQAAGVNDAQLSRFVRGERTLTLETVARLCKVLGLRFCPASIADAAPSPHPKGKRAVDEADAPTTAKRSVAEGKATGKRSKKK